MKQRLKAFISFLCIACIFSIVLMFYQIKHSDAAVIGISRKSMTLEAGRYLTLSVYGTKSKVTWKSSRTSVASVSSSGRVTAKAPGTATIYANVAGKKLSCKVTVKPTIKLNSTSFTLDKGHYKTLRISGTTAKVTWSTSKSSVASVTSGGRVTAKAAGTATITASVAGKKLTAKVTVKGTPKVSVPTKAPTVKPTPKPTVVPTTAVLSAGSASAPSAISDVILSKETGVSVPTIGQPGPTGKLVGYYAAWSRYQGFTPDKIDAAKLTHINYSFANIGSDLKIALGYPDIDPKNINQLNKIKVKFPHLKTMISIGGWTWSGRFSDVALNEQSRNTFADSCVEFVVRHGFDGVDIDWEYPVGGGLVTNGKRPEDKQNFTLLMKTLREKLDVRGAIDGKRYELSFAGAAGSWYVKNVELDQLSRYVDYANLMTYDIHGTWEQTTNFNAPLYIDSRSFLPQYGTSVDSSIRSWINAGFPKNKLVMGVPFYGIVYQTVNNADHGLYQSYSAGATISYGNIATYYLNSSGFVRYLHPEAMVPWLFNGSTFITYDDEESLRIKTDYIKRNGLAGAMIWELSQDPNRVLLDALYAGLNR